MTKPQSPLGSAALHPIARWYSPRSVWRSLVLRPRVYVSAAIGVLTLLLLPPYVPAAVREAIAWCLGGTAYLSMAFKVMVRCQHDRIRARAARQDDSGVVILALVLLAMFSSFAAIFGLIGEAKGASSGGKLFYVALAASTIFVSWLVTQVVFTLHYAHEHYAPHRLTEKGAATALSFPDTPEPDYWDFFYFATSIGAASQTADVNINSRGLRRLVTLHAIVSFIFNTMVLALTINLAASLA